MKKLMYLIKNRGMFLILLSITLSACDSNRKLVSIINLISQPSEYNGNDVVVSGFLRIKFESNALYLTSDHAKYQIFSNSIWLNLPENMTEKTKKELNNRYVRVEGIFDSKDTGHMGIFRGSINIINVTPLQASHRIEN